MLILIPLKEHRVPYDPDTAIGGRMHRFPSTRSSLFKATDSSGAIGREALSSILAVYWKPAYKYVRMKWRRSNEDAKDLVQGFFTDLIERDILANFDPAKGRFRIYFQICLDRFVMKQDEYANRLKRGGDQRFALDFDEAECELARLKGEWATDSTEEIFLCEWRREIFALALSDLESFCYQTGKEVQYRIFEQYDLTQGERPSYAEIASRHRVAVSSVTNYLAWSRRELRRLVGERVNSITPNHRESSDESRLLWRK
jgi:DNA-directed RNA polymerase specialized sigma24 family protein